MKEVNKTERLFDSLKRMDWFVNNTAQSLAQQCEALSGQNRENLTIQVAGILPWLSSRLRVFLYLSSPYEESFEFDHQVPDYHTEVSLIYENKT